VVCESGLSFGLLRTGMGMREGGEPSLEVGLAWYRGGGSRVASGVLQTARSPSKRVLIDDLDGREVERGPTMACCAAASDESDESDESWLSSESVSVSGLRRTSW
jgi:hypothetical protein